jgi:hypothetical protein
LQTSIANRNVIAWQKRKLFNIGRHVAWVNTNQFTTKKTFMEASATTAVAKNAWVHRFRRLRQHVVFHEAKHPRMLPRQGVVGLFAVMAQSVVTFLDNFTYV